MGDLKVLCDDCLLRLGIRAVPMTMTRPLPPVVGESYKCPCGRLYSVLQGYFSILIGQSGQEVQIVRRRTGPLCDSDHLSPMYIIKVLSAVSPERATFACPFVVCDKTRDEDVPAVA
jgi:hypothetical protein